MEKLGQQQKEQTERRVVCISQDSFYRTLTPSERLRAERGQFNFDHPDAFDDKKLLAILKDILAGKRVEVPEYDYITNSIRLVSNMYMLKYFISKVIMYIFNKSCHFSKKKVLHSVCEGHSNSHFRKIKTKKYFPVNLQPRT